MNIFIRPVWIAAILAASATVTQVLAEDTDIYARPASSGTNPNILIVLDNGANWNRNSNHWLGVKQSQAELRAIQTVANRLGAGVNLGLMLFTPTGDRGGYVRFKIRPMTATNKLAFSASIGDSACPSPSTNSLNGTPNCMFKDYGAEEVATSFTDYSAIMFEVFKYYGGYTSPLHAHDNIAGSPWDRTHYGPFRYAGAPDPKSDKYAFVNYATDANLTEYSTPISSTTSCAKNYVIFIGNTFPNGDNGTALLSSVGGDVTQLELNEVLDTAPVPTTETTLLETTLFGEYATQAACESAAATKYAGQYDRFSCALADTSTSGTDVQTALPSTACFDYPDAASCVAALPALYPAPYHDPYTCTEDLVASTSCVISMTTPAVMTSYSDCVASLNLDSSCQTYGAANYPGYSSFNCSNAGNTGCTGANVKHWYITANDRVSKIYRRTAYFNSLSETYSYEMYGYIDRNAKTVYTTSNFRFPDNTDRNYADEWAYFLSHSDVSAVPGFQNVITFTVDVYKDDPDTRQTALLMSMARNGGGKYFRASNESALTNALLKIVSEIQSVNSVFASSSLPVSVNTQGTYLNQVFMGMFRPDGSAAPRWAGNLKQYQFKVINGVLKLADMNGDEAISSTTGFITPCAASFWSSDTGDYWNFPGASSRGDCTALTSDFPAAGSSSVYSDYPDGEVVEKGGAAQQLRGVISSAGTLTAISTRYSTCASGTTPLTAECRRVLTCDGSSTTSCTTMDEFNSANTLITATNLNLAVASEKNNLINWVRGQDVDNENANFDNTPAPIINEVRPSVHGGVVHAQPAVVDYGGSTGVIGFYGSDDGIFHAITGNQGATDGKEIWSFIAPEHYPQLNRQRDNGVTTPRVDFPGMTGSVAPKQYGFDGSIGVYQHASTVWIFPSMRRGGRGIYAFDVSDPFNPTIKWRKGCFSPGDTLCSSSEWTKIGQTWSTPTVAHLRGYSSPVLIFGGGYDTCEDLNNKIRCGATPPSPPSTPPKGSNIWFVDANTGAIIRTYRTHYSVPADVSLLKDADGFVTHVYAADTGGYVYRINVGTYNGTSMAGAWSVDTTTTIVNSPGAISIASLSGSSNVRKFLSGPAVVQYSGFNAVLIGSGDREHPLIDDYPCTDTITNRFVMLIDKPNTYLGNATISDLVDVTTGSATFSASPPTITDNLGNTSERGWRFDFSPCEQSVNRPLVIAGVTYFGTNKPVSGSSSCATNLGVARGYAVDFLTGNPPPNSPRYAPYTGGGMPPSPVAGVVDVDGLKLPFCIGCIDTNSIDASALQGTEITINPAGSRFRSYWYIEEE